MIRNRMNKKFYVGSAAHFAARWAQHRYLLRRGKHHAKHLQAAWNKYGEQAFEFFAISYTDKQNLLLDEQWFLDNLNCVYNGSGIASRIEYTPEVRAKIAKATRSRYIVRDGKTLSEICAEHGQTKSTVYNRMRTEGCTLEEALRPVNRRHTIRGSKIHEYKGQMYNLRELAEMSGVSIASVHRRLKKGWSTKKIVEGE